MKTFLIPMLLMLIYADASSENDSTGKMFGWDDGVSIRVKIPKKIWVGANFFASSSNYESLDNFKQKTSSDTIPPSIEDGYIKTKKNSFRINFVAVYEKEPVGPIYLNPFISLGYKNDRENTDWRNQGYYIPTGNRNLNEIGISMGIEPTVKIYGHLTISMKFGFQASKMWAESSTEYNYPGDLNNYFKNNSEESFGYAYFGPSTISNLDLALHWTIK